MNISPSEAVGTLPPLVSMRPLLMLTGFLGAGKTTLLRTLLEELSSREHQADVILNDRENAEIDCETLVERAGSIAALSDSCVCCDGLEELRDLITAAAKNSHSTLLIELNGTADPVPLQETFALLESQFHLHPRWQVCVIDARFFGKRGYLGELENLQLETASHYYISHPSALSAKAERELIERVEEVNSRASRATSATLVDSLVHAIRQNRRHSLLNGKGRSVKNRAFASHQLGCALPKPQLDDRHQLAHEFTGCNIVFPAAVEADKVTAWLKLLPESVIRVKALVTLTTDLDCRFLYERVGMEVSPRALPVREVARIPCSGIFIGPDLEPDTILDITREHLHPDCHFPKL